MELKLDLARPASGEGPFPALVFIHVIGIGRGQYYLDISKAAQRGYVAVTVDHRLINVKEKGRTKRKPNYHPPQQWNGLLMDGAGIGII